MFITFLKNKYFVFRDKYQVKNDYTSINFINFFSIYLLILFSSFLGSNSLFCSKPAEITYQEVPKRVEAIFELHAGYKKYTKEIAARSLKTFAEELDPYKNYFTSEDIPEVVSPRDEQLQTMVQEYSKGIFSIYKGIYDKMLKAIERRRLLEKELKNVLETNGGTKIEPKELKHQDWAKNTSELLERLRNLRQIQLKAIKKLGRGDEMGEEAKKTLQLIEKRQKAYEDELLVAESKLSEQLVATTIVKAIARALDSQTMFFTPWEAKQFMIGVQQRLYGIGVLLRDDVDGFTIIKLVEGGPADRENANNHAKVKLKDKIVAVNDEPVVGVDVTEVVEKIRGPQGTSVKLTLLRERELDGGIDRLDVTVPRGEVIIKDARYQIRIEAYGDGVIATVMLHAFYQDDESSSVVDLMEAIKKVQRDYRLKGVLLDLRSNPGGLMSEAVLVAGMFIKKGIVVSVKDENGHVQHMRNFDTFRIWDGPLVVLVNKASASAAEIVAQTLQDYGRAIVVGDKTTFGKGSFQLFTLNPTNEATVNPKGEFKVTRGCYYTPSGKSPQVEGVVVDIVVPGAMAEAEVGERFSEYPLQPSSISPSFQDTLSDIPFLQRQQIKRVYLNDLEMPSKRWTSYLDGLKRNSEQRQTANQRYAEFLEKAKRASEDITVAEELLKQEDFQGQEALNILRDLIYFENLAQRGEQKAA